MSQGPGRKRKTKRFQVVTLKAPVAWLVFVATLQGCGVASDASKAEFADKITTSPVPFLGPIQSDLVTSLTKRKGLPFERSLKRALYEHDKNAQFDAYRSVTENLPDGFVWHAQKNLDLHDARQLYDYDLKYHGIAVEGAQLKVLNIGGELNWFSSSNPDFNKLHLTRFTLDSAAALARAAQSLNFHPWRFRVQGKVYLPSQSELRAAYSFLVSADGSEAGRGPGVPLKVFVDADTGEVLEQHPMGFDLAGVAMLYNENKIASSAEGIRQVSLPSLQGDGSKLIHELFYVVNCLSSEPSKSCKATASSTDGDYSSYGYDSNEIDELVAYHALARASAWHKTMYGHAVSTIGAKDAGTGWGVDRATLGLTSSNSLKVYVRAKTRSPSGETTLDNAQYLPAGITGVEVNPEILIGTGWEQTQDGAARALQYLGRDADVSMHEFGHHIVYRSIKETSDQSGAMHEGFADYFAYAVTGNNKLAETILRGTSPLREGNLTGSVQNYLSSPPHKAGQFWSSALWEVRESLGTWKDGIAKADRIIWDSIDFLRRNADYYEAIAAIAKSAELFAAKNGDNAVELKEKIFKVFAARSFIDASDGSGNLPPKSSVLTSGATTETVTEEETTSSKRSFLCGVVSSPSTTSASGAWLFFCLLIPALFRRKKSAASK